MNNKGLKRKIYEGLILLLCMIITVCVILVLIFVYKPGQNSLGALASVCMDVISIVAIIMMVMNLTFDKKNLDKTTRYFLGLLLATAVALFFDFLTWAFDGALSYDDLTFVYILSSLCMGGILAIFFSLYLSSYLVDMYSIQSTYKVRNVGIVINVIAFIITMTLGLTGQAFVIEAGHYNTGTLYDVVTVLPVLTLFIMTGYSIRHVKTIGIHDVIAAAGYIFTMICGVIVEAVYAIGTTYVSIAIADIFIFVMLQNKYIDRFKQQKDILDKQITSQYEILKSMAGIYSYINFVDFENKIMRRIDLDESTDEKLDFQSESHTSLNQRLYEYIVDDQKEKFMEYTDLNTLSERMKNDKIISADFCHSKDGWIRAQYIRISNTDDGVLKRVIYAIRNIDEEKKNVEKWIIKSNTDELTGFYNRYAYENEILNIQKENEDFVYVSIDLNSLKVVNDTLGHVAGDELIVGACECLEKCFGKYGKLFRIGGDEFVALIYADEEKLNEIKKELDETTMAWEGSYNKGLTLSCGYVTQSEMENMTLHQVAVLADKRMYAEKSLYYQRTGVDRRGQRNAYQALCALYTKILKINITRDTFQIINMDETEKTKESGYSEILSEWIHSFGKANMVHPEDLELFYEKTSMEYLQNYFKNSEIPFRLLYRRKYNGEFKNVMMEIIPANDYSDEEQNLFLYVKNVQE